MADVIPIAHVGKLEPGERTEPLPKCKEISEGLAGMQQVGQAVDHGLAAELGEIEDVLVRKHPGHDSVREGGEDARGVGHRLPDAHLNFVVVQDHRETAELKHPDLEGHPGARRGLLEDHGEGLAEERLLERPGIGLHLFREREDLVQVFPRVVFEGNEVFRFHGSTQIRV